MKHLPVRAPKPKTLRLFEVPDGLPPLSSLRAELADMWDVLLGRKEPPVNPNRVDALMETADAYFARANEIASLILQRKAVNTIPMAYDKFRTGELRHFIEVAKRASELGSRRVTVRQLTIESERTGRQRLVD